MTDLDRSVYKTLGYDVDEIERFLSKSEVNFDLDLNEISKIEKLTIFPLVDGINEDYLRHVYPLMQKDIKHIVDAVKDLNVGLILFGSSITALCNVSSDIDLCIETEQLDKSLFYDIMQIVSRNCEHPCDVLYLNDMDKDDGIRKEILTKGYVLRRLQHDYELKDVNGQLHGC